MEKLNVDQAARWLDELPQTRIATFGWPQPVMRDASGLAPMGPTIKHALQIRAEMDPAVTGDMWWLVDAPVLAAPSGITTDRVLALTGRDLGWCRWEGCELGQYGKFALAAVFYYQGQFLADLTAPTDKRQEAGFTVLLRYDRRDLYGMRLLAIHASRQGVQFGYRVDGDVVQLMHDASVGTMPLAGWDKLRHAGAVEEAEDASRHLRNLARHLQGALRA